MFVELTNEQIEEKINYLNQCIRAVNPAEGSKLDANANVTTKNIATIQGELNKDIFIQVNRELVCRRISELYSPELAEIYKNYIKQRIVYVHDETSLMPYCASITMFPFLLSGLKGLGGEARPPKHLYSFCGGFINLVFAVSSQLSGAVATVEFLMYFDYFARKDYGDNYLTTNPEDIKNHLKSVVYALNQPAAARNYQSVFWNISLFDEEYFNGIFGDFKFPDFSSPNYNTLKQLQIFFMEWFTAERERAVLTFPVVTAAMLTDGKKPVDEEFAREMAKQAANGAAFFTYLSESADSLSSCCRLRNDIVDNDFSYSLGAGGVATGSINVITLNINRIVQKDLNLIEICDNVRKFHHAYRTIIQDYINDGIMPIYSSGFIDIDKQFSTIGLNGVVEAAEFKGIKAKPTKEYQEFIDGILKPIFDGNKQASKDFGFKFNAEFVPAENLGVKNADWDKKDGLVVNRDCYNSYFYVVEDEETNAVDKFILHGKEYTQYLDGGSALHLNLDEYLSAEGFYKLFVLAAKTGCNYFCTNVRITYCNTCENIDKKTLQKCPKCGSEDISYGTRVIGYLRLEKNFSKTRQKEAKMRYYLK